MHPEPTVARKRRGGRVPFLPAGTIVVFSLFVVALIAAPLPEAAQGASTGNTAGLGQEAPARLDLGSDGAAPQSVGTGGELESAALPVSDGDRDFGPDGDAIAGNTALHIFDPKQIRRYEVNRGDTISSVASKFGLNATTILWNNKINAEGTLNAGRTLIIPPANGILHTVAQGDTIDSIAAKYVARAASILRYNGLGGDEDLVVGQLILVPGGRQPELEPVAVASSESRTTTSTTTRTPGRTAPRPQPVPVIGGGRMIWPVSGRGTMSRGFFRGHYGIDIAAPRGTPVLAVAGGVVVFAGWRNNGGGYQVWIRHSARLYSTYNHMSSVAVGRGAHVHPGQRVGRIGATGWATGPHLHFEMWVGRVWAGGYRVNPLRYL